MCACLRVVCVRRGSRRRPMASGCSSPRGATLPRALSPSCARSLQRRTQTSGTSAGSSCLCVRRATASQCGAGGAATPRASSGRRARCSLQSQASGHSTRSTISSFRRRCVAQLAQPAKFESCRCACQMARRWQWVAFPTAERRDREDRRARKSARLQKSPCGQQRLPQMERARLARARARVRGPHPCHGRRRARTPWQALTRGCREAYGRLCRESCPPAVVSCGSA